MKENISLEPFGIPIAVSFLNERLYLVVESFDGTISNAVSGVRTCAKMNSEFLSEKVNSSSPANREI